MLCSAYTYYVSVGMVVIVTLALSNVAVVPSAALKTMSAVSVVVPFSIVPFSTKSHNGQGGGTMPSSLNEFPASFISPLVMSPVIECSTSSASIYVIVSVPVASCFLVSGNVVALNEIDAKQAGQGTGAISESSGTVIVPNPLPSISVAQLIQEPGGGANTGALLYPKKVIPSTNVSAVHAAAVTAIVNIREFWSDDIIILIIILIIDLLLLLAL